MLPISHEAPGVPFLPAETITVVGLSLPTSDLEPSRPAVLALFTILYLQSIETFILYSSMAVSFPFSLLCFTIHWYVLKGGGSSVYPLYCLDDLDFPSVFKYAINPC